MKKTPYLLVALTLLGRFVFATAPLPDSGSLSSSNASYDGSALILKGQVLLDHGLGKMHADEAVLEKQEAGKDFPFSQIHLEKEVKIELHSDSTLRCDRADFDFSTLKATLSSASQFSYCDSLKRKKGGKTAFELLSQEGELFFSKKEEGKKTSYEIETLKAQNQVQITYEGNYILHADTVLYTKKSEGQATLLVEPKKENGLCKLTHNQDVIDAEEMQLDVREAKLSLLKPKGTLSAPLKNQKGDLHFHSDSLLWDHVRNILFLKGHIEVEDPLLGTISSMQEMQITHKKERLSTLKTIGKTTVTYLNAHALTCFGTLLVDRDKMQALAESPSHEGVTKPEEQILYREGEISLLSDKASLEYALVGEGWQPIALSLQGHIRLFSENDAKSLRKGLADRLTYSPGTRTFILGANPGKKVLFRNDEENLRLSAQEIHITQDPVTKKQVVKGIGNVSLSFTPEEENLLERFGL